MPVRMARKGYGMTQTYINKIRNIGIMAHVDAGKTTLTERILFNAGRIHKVGDVHHGNTTTDFDPEEQKHGITISTAATYCQWQDKRITILDTPGHVDFTIEVERALRVLDSAVAVFSGVAGVEPQSVNVWKQADRYAVPRICFINKMDTPGASYERVAEAIADTLGMPVLRLQLPIGEEKAFAGVVDLLDLKAWTYSDSQLTAGPVPDALTDAALEARFALVEALAELDDDCLALWMEDADISADQLRSFVRKATLACRATPALCGSAFKNIGVAPLLDAIMAFGASPVDRGAVEGTVPGTEEVLERQPDPDAPFCALVSKINVTQFGAMATVRIYAGVLAKGQSVMIADTGERLRVGRILRMHADQFEAVETARAGDVVSLPGLKSLRAAQTLCAPDALIELSGFEVPDPVISAVIEPMVKDEMDSLGLALSDLAREDPSLRLTRDDETAQRVISGMGELHLSIVQEKLESRWSIATRLGQPRVAYREQLGRTVTGEHLLKKQTSGKGQYAKLKLELGPSDTDEPGLQFESRISGGAIPGEFIPSVEKGLRAAMAVGPLDGHPLISLKAVLLDGAAHSVDSNAQAFERAAREAFRALAPTAAPVLLEPLMLVTIECPAKHIGGVLGDLGSRRGRVLDSEASAELHRISAHVPLGEMFGYVSRLRSLSSGTASMSMTFDRYQVVQT